MKNNNLPQNWKTVKLGEVGEISSGGTPDTNNLSYWNGDIFWITPTEITKLENRFIYSTERKITKEGLKNSSAKLLPINSVIVCTRATIGEIGINKVELATNQGFKNIIFNKDYSVDYVYFLLRQNKNKLIEKASGSTFLEISKSEFENVEFLLPPLPEQTRIANCLSVWDEAIEKIKKLIEAKKKLKKGLMQRLLSAKKPLPGFEGIEWRSVRLGEVCEIKKGEQLNRLDLTEIGNYPCLNGGISASGYTNKWNTEENTITISEGGNSCGYVNFNRTKFWAGGHCYVLSNLECDKLFLYQELKNKEKAIMRLRVGSGLPNIQKSAIIEFGLFIPPLVIQQRIAAILSKADEEIELLQKKLENFERQKKGLMQILLSGKVRFKEFVN